jgi:aryl-alcohol dehydrogenase-like predicted oxidoreductase
MGIPFSGLPGLSWRGETLSRIFLGTAQLGMNYGIANAQGKPDDSKVADIIETAWNLGIHCFDTAQAYGDSEAVLGRTLRRMGLNAEARIVSKLSTQMNPLDLSQIADSIKRTFDHLGTENLWCMMLHRAAWLDYWDQGLGELLLEHRNAGRIRHLGVSLDDPEEAARCLAHPAMEVLQVACNAWDRRMLRLRVLETARENGQICYARSIYLQGLLTLSPEHAAARLPIAREASIRWHELAARHGISAKEMAVRFALTLNAPLVVGAESAEQIDETVELARLGPLPKDILADLDEALDPVVDDTILTPRCWTN